MTKCEGFEELAECRCGDLRKKLINFHHRVSATIKLQLSESIKSRPELNGDSPLESNRLRISVLLNTIQ